MLKSFFHSGFIVRDIETAIDFYTNVLGFQLETRTERHGGSSLPGTRSALPKKHYIRHPMQALFPECARHTR